MDREKYDDKAPIKVYSEEEVKALVDDFTQCWNWLVNYGY